MLSRSQLSALGFTKEDVRAAGTVGLLRNLGANIFERDRSQKWLQRKLWCAALWLPRAVIARRTAGLLHGLEGIGLAPIEVFDTCGRKERHNVHVLRRELDEADIELVKGFKTTNATRTLIDLASVLSEENLAWAMEHAWRKGLSNPYKVRTRLNELRTSGVEGMVLLDRILDDCERRLQPLESGLEVRMWWALRREQLHPIPQMSVYDEQGELRIDFAFVYERVALETMGKRWHEQRHNWERDCERALRLSALGWSVVPVTWNMLDTDREGVLSRLRYALRTHDRRNMRKKCVAGELGINKDVLLHPRPQVVRWKRDLRTGGTKRASTR